MHRSLEYINFLLEGFGFEDTNEFLKSTFGFVYTSKMVIQWNLIVGFIISTIPALFGFNHYVFYAIVLLLIGEWWTGTKASRKRGEEHKSRLVSRMIVKFGVYLFLLHTLHVLENNIKFPKINNLELDPLNWGYWTTFFIIIWQQLVSVMENLKSLGYKFADVLLKIINKKFYQQFELEEGEKKD